MKPSPRARSHLNGRGEYTSDSLNPSGWALHDYQRTGLVQGPGGGDLFLIQSQWFGAMQLQPGRRRTYFLDAGRWLLPVVRWGAIQRPGSRSSVPSIQPAAEPSYWRVTVMVRPSGLSRI